MKDPAHFKPLCSYDTRFQDIRKKQLRGNEPGSALEELISCEGKWNFDLDDCDHILRIESRQIHAKQVELALLKSGYQCTELED